MSVTAVHLWIKTGFPAVPLAKVEAQSTQLFHPDSIPPLSKNTETFLSLLKATEKKRDNLLFITEAQNKNNNVTALTLLTVKQNNLQLTAYLKNNTQILGVSVSKHNQKQQSRQNI